MSRPQPGGPSRRTTAAIVAALVVRPGLWVTALATVVRWAAPGWWRRPPYLPLPDGRLWGFRLETAYGRTDADPDVDDVVAYLEWCSRGHGRGRRGWWARPPSSFDVDPSPLGSRRRPDGPG